MIYDHEWRGAEVRRNFGVLTLSFQMARRSRLNFRCHSARGKRNFRPRVRISRSHPTKPPQQQYDAPVGSYLLSIGQFSYCYSILRPSRHRDANSESVPNAVVLIGHAGVTCHLSPLASWHAQTSLMYLVWPSASSLLILQCFQCFPLRSFR